MIKLYPSSEDNSKPFRFIPVPNSRPSAQETELFQTPPLFDPDPAQPITNLELAGHGENPFQPRENSMRINGEWSGSRALEPMGGSSCFGVGQRGDAWFGTYRNNLYGFGVGNEMGVDRMPYPNPNHQILAGDGAFVGGGNGNTVNSQRIFGFSRRGKPLSEKQYRRIIRNRESAARSRARKQAQNAQYLIDIGTLKRENKILTNTIEFLASLKTKREQRPTLTRTFSSPF